jgi:lipopolysaccharide transport system ATP-binding protein
MPMDIIVARGITKTYRAGVGRARVREMLPSPADRALSGLFPRWWARDTFNALEDVSVSVAGGSSVGIVGPNGAGKTTLLKVICGVTAPTRGTVSTTGRVAALIDVVVGFHPDLTGRENVFLLAAMHGYGARAMAPRLDRVREFSEIGDALDTPLKRYSAGMAARLAFATMSSIEPEILLVDEVLAVGDGAFQRKCVRWLHEYREGGGSLLFVSHNLGLVRNMTERAVRLDHGRVVDEGPTAEVLSKYARALERRDVAAHVDPRRGARKLMRTQGLDRWGAGGARVDEVHLGEPSANGGSLEVAITYEVDGLDGAVFCLGFTDEGGREIGASASPPMRVAPGKGEVRCALSPLPLRTGIYFPVVAILSADGQVRDRWKLDRAVVVDRNGDASVADFGPVDIGGVWSETGGQA